MLSKEHSFDKLTPNEKSALADKLLTGFYFCIAIAFCYVYLGIRLQIESTPQAIVSFLELGLVENSAFAVFFLSIGAGAILLNIFSYKAYGWSFLGGIYSLFDIRLRHLKPLLIVPIFVLFSEALIYLFF